MAYIGQVFYASVAVFLLTWIPGSIADQDNSNYIEYSNYNSSNWMEMFLENNASNAYQCVSEKLNMTEITHKMRSLQRSIMTAQQGQQEHQEENYLAPFVKAIMKMVCRDHVMQFLTCIDQGLRSGTTAIERILHKLVDMPRILALAQYLCGKIDIIADNYACALYRTKNMTDLGKCVNATSASFHGLLNQTETYEEAVRHALGALIKYGICLKPATKGCGGLEGVYEHTLGEITSMYEGEKYTNGAKTVTGHSSLLVTFISASAVVLRLGYW